ncbi:MAG TPA: MarR family transcriptional regulator [Streptosporangiaceae bacterium]|nr:MarR family transcriptional regulator [Streptosporangiaceae bacterium]
METTTRWLTEEEQRVWRQFLTACQSLFGGIDAQLLRDSGLPHGYYEILVRLSETPGRALRMTQLAAASTFSKSRLSHAVSRLEQRGLVIREDCATDRRGQIARLTDAGLEVLKAAAPGHVEQVRRSLIDALTPEQVRQLGEISAAMIAVAAPGAASGCQEADEAMSADPIAACQEADEAMGGCGRLDDELD